VTSAGVAGVAGIWQKLRRRKVVQWGVGYCAAAWGLLQGLDYATATFHWSDHIQQLATLALLIGLPIVLVLAWYHGDRGEQHFQRTELALVALLVLAGGILLWRYEPASEVASRVDARPTAASRTSADPRPSIAILPFENRSQLADDAYFVDGIHDDILTQVSKVSALKVISRDSVERLRGAKLSTREIAEQLGVTSVLQGGVQRAGDRVRIHVRLIDANTDANLWAERFDRALTAANLFAIQSEVAAEIAGALQATLTPAEHARLSAPSTTNLEAWQAYHLAWQHAERRTSTSLAEAERLLQQAIDLDPDFALAYLSLATIAWLQVQYSGRDPYKARARAEALVKHALMLQPDLPEAAGQLALLAYWAGDSKRAIAEYERAIALLPNDAGLRLAYSNQLSWAGRPEEALREIEIALELDPISPPIIWTSANKLINLGREDEALARLRKAMEIDPEFPNSYAAISQVYASRGRLDLAIPWQEKTASLDPGNPQRLTLLGRSYLQLGDDAQAARWLGRALQHHPYFRHGEVQELAAILSLQRGDYDAFERHARKAAEHNFIRMLVFSDLRRGDYAAARARYTKEFPELFAAEPSAGSWDDSAGEAAIDLAYVLQHTGDENDKKRARKLLDLSQAYLGESTDIDVVAIHALRGEVAQALVKLREGRAIWGTNALGWQYHRDIDPRLESIRDRPEFKAFFAGVEAEMAAQRARLAARPKNAPLVIEDLAKLN
jgi:TolB-like protein/Tfp pilus assembly protein PilF